MQYVWLVLVMFGNPHRLYPVNIFSGITKGNLPHRSTHALVSVCTHVEVHTHTHTVVGKWRWKAGLKLLLRNCLVHHVAVAQFHLSLAHLKSPKCFLCILICFYILKLLVIWMGSLFLALLKLFRAHLQRGSDPFRLFLCKADLRGSMMHISRMLSLGWWAEFLPK